MPDLTDQQINMISAIATAGAAIAAVFALIATIINNNRIIKVMRQDRFDRSRPVILVGLIADAESNEIHLSVGNYSQGAADQVHFLFNASLMNSENVDVTTNPIFLKGVSIMAPQQYETIYFDRYSDFFSIDYFFGRRSTDYTITVKSNDPTTARPNPPAKIKLDLNTIAPIGVSGAIHQSPLYEQGWQWRWRVDHPASTMRSYEMIRDDVLNWLFSSEDSEDGKHRVQMVISNVNRWNPQNIMAIQEILEERFHKHGWRLFDDNWSRETAELALVKQYGRHRGEVVISRGWTIESALILALDAIVHLETKWVTESTTPPEAKPRRGWQDSLTQLRRKLSVER